MRRTGLIIAAGAAALVGAGATAVATPGPVTAGRPVAGAALAANRSPSTVRPGAAGMRHRKLQRLLRRTEHARLVTSGPGGPFELDAVRGVVSAVSPTSLTVRAADTFRQTFVLSSSVTRVRVRPARTAGGHPGKGRGAAGSLSDIHRGDEVFAFGRAADKAGAVPTARIVVVG